MSVDTAVSVVETTPDVNPSEESAPVSTAVTPAAKKKAPKKGVRTEAKAAASGNKTGTRKAPPPAAKIPSKKPPGRDAYRRHQELANVFKNLGSPVRIALMEAMKDGPVRVGELCIAVTQTQPAVSHHLAIFRHAGVAETERDGKNILYFLTEKGKDLAKIIEKYGEKMDKAAAK